MGKWFLVTFAVVVIFAFILLAFGYLLKSNEQANIDYIERHSVSEATQDKAKVSQQTRAILSYIEPPESKSTTQREVLLNNLTCVSDGQCLVEDIEFVNGRCTVAVNQVGALMLKRYDGEKSDIGACALSTQPRQVRCKENICTLTKS